jgi:ABC-type phosphate transport system substrate-binding protein
MRMMLRRYRRGVVVLSAVLGASVVLATAVPAGATTVSPANTVLNAGGSYTTYAMMQQLSDLYSSSPGCNLLTANSNNQELNYACASSYSTAATGGENGYTLTPPLNPYNDVVWQESAMGSSNGIKELELEGADTPTSAPDNEIASVDFARSSRAAVTTGSSPDKAGLNFVAYAEDAVPWFHFTSVKGTTCSTGSTSTPSKSITTLTNAQLTSIYEGNTTNWSSVGGSSAPIDVFIAQSGSGTESTWATDLNLSGTYPYGGVTATASRLSLPATDFEIFENEVSDIFANPDAFSQDVACNAIFFFSYGKYSILCPSGKCVGQPASGAGKGSKSKLGEINGVTASQSTIQDGSYFTDRQLYNVYSDGSNCNLPFANTPTNCPSADANTGTLPPVTNQAVQNFVGTYGFLCNPNSYSVVDPISATGQTYGQEIDSIITTQGFFPIPLGVEGDSSVATPPDPSQSGYDAGYAAAEPAPSGDKGYCRITTTDQDGNN